MRQLRTRRLLKMSFIKLNFDRAPRYTSAGEIHPGVAVQSEGVAARVHLDIGPVRGDDPDLTIALHLDAASVDS